MKSSATTIAGLLVCLSFAGSGDAAPEQAAAGLRTADILAHLARSIEWYRNIYAVEQSAQLSTDVLARDNTQRTSTRALQLAFEFARAAVPLVSDERRPAASKPSTGFNVEQAFTQASERVTALEARVAELNAAIRSSGARTRPALVARRKELLAQIGLAKEVKNSMQGLRTFLSGQAAGSGSALPGYIDRLERSVPEAMRGAQPPVPAAPVQAGVAAAPMFRPESAGIVGLVTETIRAFRGRRQIDDALAGTDTLRTNVMGIRTLLVDDLKNTIRRSDTAAGNSASQDVEQIDADRREIEALTVRFKQLSAALGPLREQGALVEAARGNLIEWRSWLERRYSSAGSYLFFRLLTLVVMVAAVLAISALWRRGTFRYVRDARRRKQFLVLRRVVVTCAVAVMLVMGLMSELGSLATYAGFLTAGLAVALQNVIVSVVAYFFLVGRYGLRVGDRVTISGVTGDVLDIGLVRTHIMEVTGADGDLHTSGRVVAFSNSVVFQPAALFKQLPGTDYVWHTAELTLAPDTDVGLAKTRLMAAVNAVYEQYRERIEKQHDTLQRLVDLPVSPPQPEGTLRFTNAGLEFHVRYPVEIREAPATDDRVIKALHDAIAEEPRLSLATSGAPKLHAAT